MDVREGRSAGGKNRPLHVIAGKILEIGDGYVLLGFSSAPVRLTDELANSLHPGQLLTITAVLIDGEFIAQKNEMAPRSPSPPRRTNPGAPIDTVIPTNKWTVSRRVSAILRS